MADAGHSRTDKKLEELEKKIAAEYKQASEEVQAKLDDYLRRFDTKDKIWQQRVESGKATQEEYDKWRVGQMAVGDRWKQMRDELAEDYHNANAIARGYIDQAAKDVYAENHNFATYEIEHGGKVNTSYTLYSHESVERIIRDNPAILPPPGKGIAKDLRWQEGQIQSVTLQAILQGESIPNIAKRIAETMGEQNHKSTIRYARTAITGAQNAGRQDAYHRAEELGVNMKREWVATLDNRTRHEHRILDGQVRGVDEPFEVDGEQIMYPGDPAAADYLIWNCRCTTVAKVDGWEDISGQLRSDESIGGMSYEEWLEAKPTYDLITKQEEIAELMKHSYINELYGGAGDGEGEIKTPTLQEMIEADSDKFNYTQKSALLYYAEHGEFPKGTSAYQKKKLQSVIDGYNNGIQGRDVQLVPAQQKIKDTDLPSADEFNLPDETRKEADSWVKEEHESHQYTKEQLEAMEAYMMESDNINGALRGYLDYDKSIIRELSSSMTKYDSYDSVYRGVDGIVLGIHSGDSVESIRERLVGKSYTEKGFMSTSRSLDVAKEFSERGAFDMMDAERPCVLILDIHGSDVAYFDSGLAEIVLDKGSTITYVDVKEENGVLKIFGKVTQKGR